MMGVPLKWPDIIFSENDSAVKSIVNSESRLSKNNVSIAYYKCRECFSVGIMNLYLEFSEDNSANLFTKGTTSNKKEKVL